MDIKPLLAAYLERQKLAGFKLPHMFKELPVGWKFTVELTFTPEEETFEYRMKLFRKGLRGTNPPVWPLAGEPAGWVNCYVENEFGVRASCSGISFGKYGQSAEQLDAEISSSVATAESHSLDLINYIMEQLNPPPPILSEDDKSRLKEKFERKRTGLGRFWRAIS